MAAHDVGFDDFVHVSLRDVSVPDGVRVDDQVRAMLTLIEASSLVSAHFALQAALSQLLFEELLQFGLAVRITASARMSRRALIAANKNVFLELWHGILVRNSRRSSTLGAFLNLLSHLDLTFQLPFNLI
jgi:hypothetical protein